MCVIRRHETKWGVAALLGLALLSQPACRRGSGPTRPSPAAPLHTAVISVSRVEVSSWSTSRGRTYGIVFSVIETAGVKARLADVTIVLSSGGSPFLVRRFASGLEVTEAMARPDYSIEDIDPQQPVADRAEVQLKYSDANGHADLTTSFSAAVTLIELPVIAFSADKTTLNVGESTTLRWMVTGAQSQLIDGVKVGPDQLPASGTVQVRPCPGRTTFTLSAWNLAGRNTSTVEITAAASPHVLSLCGNWGGTYSETWSDSAGGGGTYSNAIGLALPQWERNFTGTWERSIPNHGSYRADLTAMVIGWDVTGTLVYRSGTSSPELACPARVAAKVSDGATEMSGTYESDCQIADGRRVIVKGTFTLRKLTQPYPDPAAAPSAGFLLDARLGATTTFHGLPDLVWTDPPEL